MTCTAANVAEPREARVDARSVLPYVVAGWLGVVCAYVYAVVVVQPGWPLAADLHRQIIDGTAPSPYRSRVLLPFLAEGLSRVMTLESGYLLLYFAVFPIAFCSLYALLRKWHQPTLALVGVLLVGSVMPLALRDHFYQPATWLELVLMIAALHLLTRPTVDLRWYTTIAVVAALNRETGMLLGLLLLVTTWSSSRSPRGRLLACAAAPVVAYATIRVVRGGGPPAEHDLLSRNLHDLPIAMIQITLFAGVIVYLLHVGWAHAPVALRQATLILPPYLAFVAVFGIWRETRLLVPLLPLALCIGLNALTQLDDEAWAPSSATVQAPDIPPDAVSMPTTDHSRREPTMRLGVTDSVTRSRHDARKGEEDQPAQRGTTGNWMDDRRRRPVAAGERAAPTGFEPVPPP